MASTFVILNSGLNSNLSVKLLLRTDLPSHPPDPVIEVMADDAELPYLRGVAHVRSYAGAVIVIDHTDYAQCLRSVFREFAQVHD